MKLSQSVTYAIHAVLRLAENHRALPVSCGKLAEQGKMPERFLLQILRDLAKQGILQSTRGGGGGFTLGRRPEEISLLEVVEAVDGPLCASLPLKGNFPARAGERLQEALGRIAEVTRRQLEAVKVTDLMVRRDPTAAPDELVATGTGAP
jgi:Rrf2 family transcriptional regulator, cysteine metabolism repressor